MHGILQRKVEQVGADNQERLMLSFDKMFPRERHTALGELFMYWQAKRIDGEGLPYEDNFSSGELLPEPCRDFTAWVEATSPDPFNFTISKHPSLLEWGNRSNRRVGELDSMMNAKSCAVEYLACIKSRQPMYHEIEQTVGGHSRHYVRLLLPLLDKAKDVSRLFYAVRIFNGTGFGSSPASS